MHTKTYQYMMSSDRTNQLKAELKDILRRDDEDRSQTIPPTGLLVAMAELALLRINGDQTQNSDHLLDTIGALHTRNKGLQKGHATLTRQVQELETELALTKQQLLSASGTAFAVAGGEVWINNRLLTEKSFSKTPWSDRAVDAIIADVLKDDSKHLEKLKPKPTAADHQLADDIYSLRRRIACDLHDWSKEAEPVLSRLAAAEHAIKLHNQMRRSGK